METLPNGTLIINFGETKVRVKTPTWGQYRYLRERIYTSDEERRILFDKWSAEAELPDPFPETWTTEQIADAKINGVTLPTGPTAEQIAARNAVVRKSNEYNENALMDWWHLVLTGDSSSEPPFPSLAIDTVPSFNTDEWPMELASTLSYAKAMAHWVSAPFDSSNTQPATTSEPQP